MDQFYTQNCYRMIKDDDQHLHIRCRCNSHITQKKFNKLMNCYFCLYLTLIVQ